MILFFKKNKPLPLGAVLFCFLKRQFNCKFESLDQMDFRLGYKAKWYNADVC
jgi:hypothetical protein